MRTPSEAACETLPLSREEWCSSGQEWSFEAEEGVRISPTHGSWIEAPAYSSGHTVTMRPCRTCATTNLAPPISWELVTNAVVRTNGQVWLTLPLQGPRGFFRLQAP